MLDRTLAGKEDSFTDSFTDMVLDFDDESVIRAHFVFRVLKCCLLRGALLPFMKERRSGVVRMIDWSKKAIKVHACFPSTLIIGAVCVQGP